MSISLIIWLADVSANFATLLGIASGVGAVLLLLYFGASLAESHEYSKVGVGVWSLIVSIAAITAVMLPSKQALYMIAGVSVAEKVIADPRVQATTEKVILLINSKLDAEIGKLTEGKNKPPANPKDKTP